MQEIAIIFSNPKKFMFHTFITQYFDRAPYSHVCISFVDKETGQTMVFEASYGEAHYITYTNWLKKNKAVKIYKSTINSIKHIEMKRAFNRMCQVRYGFIALLGIFFDMTVGLKRNIFAKGKKDLICSEVVAYFLQDIKEMKLSKGIELITPRDIEITIENSPLFTLAN